MTLLELCEPLFLKICELNRMARLRQSQNYLEVRAEIKEALTEIHRTIQSEAALGRVAGTPLNLKRNRTGGESGETMPVREIELVLVFFVDSMIASSTLQFAADWARNRLAVEQFNELAGDDRFFEILEQTINDPSDEATERLAVFYACLGLGFVGSSTAPEVKRYMTSMVPRLKHLMDLDSSARLCPDAYKGVDTRNFIQPPSNRLALVLGLFVFLCLATMIAYVGMYVTATQELNGAVETINQKPP